jgi:hypothetical protein
VNNPYNLGRVVEQQAWLWYRQRKFEEARSAVSNAADIFERLGTTKDAGRCNALLWKIEREAEGQV